MGPGVTQRVGRAGVAPVSVMLSSRVVVRACWCAAAVVCGATEQRAAARNHGRGVEGGAKKKKKGPSFHLKSDFHSQDKEEMFQR